MVCAARTLGVKRFHGPAETIQAAQSGENVDIRIGFGSTLAALISVGGAVSVGQYGPLVHLGGAIGSGVSRVLRSTISTSTWIVRCCWRHCCGLWHTDGGNCLLP